MIPGTILHKTSPKRSSTHNKENEIANRNQSRQSAAEITESPMSRRKLFSAILPIFSDKLVAGLRTVENIKRDGQEFLDEKLEDKK